MSECWHPTYFPASSCRNPVSIFSSNISLIYFCLKRCQHCDPECFSLITKACPLESWAESRWVERSSICLHLQPSLFLSAHWPSTTQAAIHWWQLTYCTSWGNFCCCFIFLAGRQRHKHAENHRSQVLLFEFSCTHLETVSSESSQTDSPARSEILTYIDCAPYFCPDYPKYHITLTCTHNSKMNFW